MNLTLSWKVEGSSLLQISNIGVLGKGTLTQCTAPPEKKQIFKQNWKQICNIEQIYKLTK